MSISAEAHLNVRYCARPITLEYPYLVLLHIEFPVASSQSEKKKYTFDPIRISKPWFAIGVHLPDRTFPEDASATPRSNRSNSSSSLVLKSFVHSILSLVTSRY